MFQDFQSIFHLLTYLRLCYNYIAITCFYEVINDCYILVLEATDADTLLDQFEEVASDFEDDQNGNPKKTSNIYKAVQKHFANSVAATSKDSKAAKRLPKIGKIFFKYGVFR